jgi:hypothetical protein
MRFAPLSADISRLAKKKVKEGFKSTPLSTPRQSFDVVNSHQLRDEVGVAGNGNASATGEGMGSVVSDREKEGHGARVLGAMLASDRAQELGQTDQRRATGLQVKVCVRALVVVFCTAWVLLATREMFCVVCSLDDVYSNFLTRLLCSASPY